MGCAQNDDVIQARPSDAPDHPLRIRILPGAPRRGQELVHALVRDPPLTPIPIHRIPKTPSCRDTGMRIRLTRNASSARTTGVMVQDPLAEAAIEGRQLDADGREYQVGR